jgi:hypothetical protein
VAYFATDPRLSAASILEAVADRGALEQVFHHTKEVHGAGQQQLRHVWANGGAWNLIGWWYTLVELWGWSRSQPMPAPAIVTHRWCFTRGSGPTRPVRPFGCEPDPKLGVSYGNDAAYLLRCRNEFLDTTVNTAEQPPRMIPYGAGDSLLE